ncbi:lipopolysaccharide biosynthesis protein [Arsenophonus endosymbiont of Lipoptena cervi]|uniref:lipopolysaccharide biosynthesis protein n=1 Tax=Arsenophonus endosymbiont of Lipoptena cervi TaxID=363258 RepID=UPI00376EFFAF
MQSRTLKNFLNYAIGDILIKGFLFISIPIFSYLFDPIQYGYYSLINNSIIILYVFISLNLQNAVINRCMITKKNLYSYLSTIIYFIIPFQIILILFEPFYSAFISYYLGINQKDFIFILIICIMLTYIYIYTAYLQASSQSYHYIMINTISKIIETILIFYFAYFLTSNKYMSKIYAQIIINIIIIIYIIVSFKFKFSKFKFKYLKEALIFSIPLMGHVISNALLAQIDKIIISKFIGLYDAGIYSFTYNFSICIIIIIIAWNSAWRPNFYYFLNNKNYCVIKKITYGSTILIFLTCIISMLFSKEMIYFLSSYKYHSSIPILPLIIIGNALIHIYLIYVNFLFYKRKTIIISCATFGVLIINIILNYYLVPKFNITGSACSTIISYFFLALLNYSITTYITKNNIISFKYLIFYTIGLLSTYPIILYLNNLNLIISLLIKFIIFSIIIMFIKKFAILKLLNN